jgi:alkylation response protein AidB-like acyl-CoA dehydrogenase
MATTTSERAREVAKLVDERFGPFLRERVNPGSAERDRTCTPVPQELFREAVACGLATMHMHESVGGGGIDACEWGLVLEQVGFLCDDGPFITMVGAMASMVNALVATGRQELIERYALPVSRGERFGCFAYTDGRDAFDFFSTCEEQSDGSWILNGKKPLVGGALTEHPFFVTYVRDVASNDLMAFIVERDDVGLRRIPVETYGMRATGFARLEFENLRVPKERIYVDSDGLAQAQVWLNPRRVGLACPMLGRMQATFDKAVDVLTSKIRYNRPVADMGNVQAALGRCYVRIESSRSIVYRALEGLRGGDFDPQWDPIIAAAKHHVTEQATALGQEMFRLQGTEGYIRGEPWERYVRDVAALIAGASTQDIVEVDLGVVACGMHRARKSKR